MLRVRVIPRLFKISKIAKSGFPRCTRIISRSQRFQDVTVQEILRFQDSCNIIKLIKHNIIYFSNVLQNYLDLLRFQDYQKCFRISRILWRFHHVGLPLLFKTIVNADCLGRTKIKLSIWVTPTTFFICQTCQISKLQVPKISKFRKCVLDLFLNVQSDLVYSNPEIRVPTGLKNPEIMEMLCFGLSRKQIEKL